jgi:polyisoprenyl-phosphate glycosyltransferase
MRGPAVGADSGPMATAVPVLSLVFPVFDEEANIPELYRRLTLVLENLKEPYEIIFVNDGSTDQSLRLLSVLATQDQRVKVVNFSRNFGHQIAITAGLDYSRGQAVIVMDADLQHPPEVLPLLLQKWREEYDVVYAVRTERQGEGVFKRGTAALFYHLLKRVTRIDIPANAGDFRLVSRRAVEAMRMLRERQRFVRGLSSWIGFRQTAVSFVQEARYAGATKYPLRKMLKFAFDGITSFSFAPLQLATYLGFSAAAVSFCYVLYAMGLKLFTDRSVAGWASLIVAILFIGGVQLITLGIIGEYVGRIYEEVKQRPLYIIADTLGFSKESEEHVGSVKTSSQQER